MATARKTKRSKGRVGRARARPPVAPPPVVAEPELPVVEAVESLSELALVDPEPAFAARALPVEPPRPLPAGRRAIFFDVENTSRAEHIARVMAHLAVDRGGRRTEFYAVGNWRVIGHDTARLLARHGAALVHSAPSVGVRDWSDLRIAVASGVWLAGGRPGDVIEIVSDDRAFDAVGDVAASLGVTFRRLSYRGLLGQPAEAPVAVEAASSEAYGLGERGERGGRRRRRRGGRGRGDHGRSDHGRDHGGPRPPVHHAPAPSAESPAESPAEAEPHSAPHDEIVSVVRDLVRSGRTVTLDSLANALKARGFSRPPGSPRLITRLRRIKELEISRAGVITIVGEGEPSTVPAAPVMHEADVARDAEAVPFEPEPVEAAADEPGPEAEPVEAEATAEPPEPGNEAGRVVTSGGGGGGRGGVGGEEGRRRRSRRGGRRRRGGRGGGPEGGGWRDGGGSGGSGGGGGGRPRDDTPPRTTGADRTRDVASRFAPRDVAPSWISGQPLA